MASVPGVYCLLSSFSLQPGSGGITANGFILGTSPTRDPNPANVQRPQPGLASPDSAFGCRRFAVPSCAEPFAVQCVPLSLVNAEVPWAVLRGADSLAPSPSQVLALTFN